MDLTSLTRARGRRLLGAVSAACLIGAAAMAVPAAPMAYAAYAASAESAHRADASGSSSPGTVTQVDSAALVQCQTATEQAERSATFAGEMTLIPGAVHMAMRIELLERAPGETGYRPVLAPGVGVWRAADPGVKAYKHLEQVTNLAAPAYYRALITFRWVGPHGRLLRREERRSPRCVQPAPVIATAPGGAGTSVPQGAGTSATTPAGSAATFATFAPADTRRPPARPAARMIRR